jgi:fructokinase
MRRQLMETKMLYGGIEAGGTKFNCVLGSSPQTILARATFPTTTPAETIGRAVAFFSNATEKYAPIAALGIASFGPVDLAPTSRTFGYITTTPKAHWSQTNLLGEMQAALGVPVSLDTDVNGSALGEGVCGAAMGLDNYIYVTIGTGVGAGIYANGRPMNGANHPEVGHMIIPKAAEDSTFAGNCPFHGDCLEGLVSGPALKARWGCNAELLGKDHVAWRLQAHYLAVMCVNLTLCYSPEKIILGGGVMTQAQLFPMIRREFACLMNDYTKGSATDHLNNFIVPPALDDSAGVIGSLIMAERVACQERAPGLAVPEITPTRR